MTTDIWSDMSIANVLNVLFSFKGRITRMTWWFGMLIVASVSLVSAYFLVPGFFNLESDVLMPTSVPDTLIQSALLVPTTAITVKRLADRDWPLWIAYPLAAQWFVIIIGPHFGFLSGARAASRFELNFLLVALVATAAMIIDNGFFPGTRGPNRYGPDPHDDDGNAKQ